MTPEEKRAKMRELLKWKQEASDEAQVAMDLDKPTSLGEMIDVAGTAGLTAVTGNWADEVAAEAGDLSDEETRLMRMELDARRNRNVGNAAAGLAGDVIGSLALPVVKAGKAGLAIAGAVSGAGGGEDPGSRTLGAALGALLGLAPAAGKAVLNKLTGNAAAKKEAEALIKQYAQETPVAAPQGTVADVGLLESLKNKLGLGPKPKPIDIPVGPAREMPGEVFDPAADAAVVVRGPGLPVAAGIEGGQALPGNVNLDPALPVGPEQRAVNEALARFAPARQELGVGGAQNPVLTEAIKQADEFKRLAGREFTPGEYRELVQLKVQQILSGPRPPRLED
jgi:hypothetical protein